MSCMADSVRAEDIVCRYGGEEFVIVMPDGDPVACARRARELCASVRTLAVEHSGEPLRAVSISIGVARLGHDGATAGDLLHAADEALYRAKAQGRNRVVEATPTRSPSVVVNPLTDEPAGFRAA